MCLSCVWCVGCACRLFMVVCVCVRACACGCVCTCMCICVWVYGCMCFCVLYVCVVFVLYRCCVCCVTHLRAERAERLARRAEPERMRAGQAQGREVHQPVVASEIPVRECQGKGLHRGGGSLYSLHDASAGLRALGGAQVRGIACARARAAEMRARNRKGGRVCMRCACRVQARWPHQCDGASAMAFLARDAKPQC